MPSSEQPPLVSVVIPTYNRGTYLREAVQSVLDQSYQAWELIVVDDGSTDDSLRFVEALGDPRIQVMSLPHCGNPGALRNRGMAQARGVFVAFLDSDDCWLPEKLRLQVEDLETHSECGWSYTYLTPVGPGLEPLPLTPGRSGRPFRGNIAPALAALEASVTTPTVLLRRELAAKVGGFDETFRFCEDYDLWIRCALASPVSVVTTPLVLIRVHSGSNTHERLEVLEYWVRLGEKLRGTAADPELRRLGGVLCWTMLMRLAAQFRSRGASRQSLGALRRALRYHAPTGSWWRSVGKTLLRPVLPQTLLRWRRARAANQASPGVLGL